MFKRQTTGSVVCASCGSLVGVNDETCYSCGRRNPGLWGYAPLLRRMGNDLGFINLVVYGCIAIHAATLLTSLVLHEDIMRPSLFSLLGPGPETVLRFGASGSYPVFVLGRWWTVLSAGWLHGGALHIFFNLMWVRQLGPAVADLYGAGRMVIIYTLASVCGFLLTSAMPPLPILGGASLTLGASAAIFGLLGAVVYYGRRSGSSLIRSEAWGYAITMFVFGVIMPGVDNYAHAGGFAGGYLAGMWLDPLKRERGDHLLAAVVCLVLTALSILASLLIPLPPFVFGR